MKPTPTPTAEPLILPAPTPGPDGALIEHHLVQCVQDGSVPVRRLAALLGVSKATLYKIASGGGASTALLVKFGAMVGTLRAEGCADALAALGLDGSLREGLKLRGRVQIRPAVTTGYEVEVRLNPTQLQIAHPPDLPEVCPACCVAPIVAGLARPGMTCQGCQPCP